MTSMLAKVETPVVTFELPNTRPFPVAFILPFTFPVRFPDKVLSLIHI